MIIDENEKLGVLVGSVNATADKENKIDAHVTSWHRIEPQEAGDHLDTIKMVLREPVTKKP